MSDEETLEPLSADGLAAFARVAPEIEAEVTRLCVATDAPEATMGPDAAAKIRAGLSFVTAKLRASMTYAATEIMTDQATWSREHLPVAGVSLEMIAQNLRRYDDELARRLSPEAAGAVRPYVAALLARFGSGGAR